MIELLGFGLAVGVVVLEGVFLAQCHGEKKRLEQRVDELEREALRLQAENDELKAKIAGLTIGVI